MHVYWVCVCVCYLCGSLCGQSSSRGVCVSACVRCAQSRCVSSELRWINFSSASNAERLPPKEKNTRKYLKVTPTHARTGIYKQTASAWNTHEGQNCSINNKTTHTETHTEGDSKILHHCWNYLESNHSSAPHLYSTLPVSLAGRSTSPTNTGGLLPCLQGEITGHCTRQLLTQENTGKPNLQLSGSYFSHC